MALFKRKSAGRLAEEIVTGGLAEIQAEKDELQDVKRKLDVGLDHLGDIEEHVNNVLEIDSKLQILFKKTLKSWKDAQSIDWAPVAAQQLGNIFSEMTEVEAAIEDYARKESIEQKLLAQLEKDLESNMKSLKQAIRHIKTFAKSANRRAHKINQLANEAYNQVKDQSGVPTEKWRGARLRETQRSKDLAGKSAAGRASMTGR